MTASGSITPPFLSSRILVFSDFNCPYCYTLNEWIAELGGDSRVRWVGIEHRPDLPTTGPNLPQDAALLDTEVRDVANRAPTVSVVKPDFWVNSRQALLVQNAIEDDAPDAAPDLRRQLFQAYWRDGHLISDRNVVGQALETLNLEDPDLEPSYLEELTSWWRTHLDRIPAMIAPTEVSHLGLQDKESVRRFLNSALRESRAGPGCS